MGLNGIGGLLGTEHGAVGNLFSRCWPGLGFSRRVGLPTRWVLSWSFWRWPDCDRDVAAKTGTFQGRSALARPVHL